MKKVMICLMLCSALFLAGCGDSDKKASTGDAPNSTEISAIDKDNNSSTENNDTKAKTNVSSTKNADTKKSTVDSKKSADKTKSNSAASPSKEGSSKDSSKTVNIKSKVKEYILGDQGNKAEAGRIKWSRAFLDRVDVDSLYNQYIKDGGNKNSVENFALYITKNAPIQSDWKKLFEKDLKAQYDNKVTKYEALGDNMYQVYVMNEGKEVPYVTVNARTGYYHG